MSEKEQEMTSKKLGLHVGDSFQELGSITGEEILKNPEVKQQLKGVVRYLDLNKLVMTFLTPDILGKLGVVR